MTDIFRTLQEITTDYSIFEKDQVLTESQLNSVTNYLNDQNRLTRVYLLGVGTIAGLRVSLENNKVLVTKGIGITTDGDLFYYNTDTRFDRYLQYDKSYPKYAPFYQGENINGDVVPVPVYELIRQEAKDDRLSIAFLNEFTARTNKDLKNMVAVAFVESYINDPDLCTGTDCDNLGKDCQETPKILLIEKSSLNSLLKPTIPTPDSAYKNLDEIAIDRPFISNNFISINELAQTYRTVCTTLHNKLIAALSKIYPNCSAFLGDVFPSNPSNAWTTKLTSILGTFTNTTLGIQYYYGFLKDVIETYQEFRELLFGNTTLCCPDLNWFPKHLLLGDVVNTTDPNNNRTPFYPSPAVSQNTDSFNHIKFLARKLDTLIQTFQVPPVSAPIRITPSLSEDHPLEERSIPYYYLINSTNPIHQYWNYSLSQRGTANRNYGYQASNYGAVGAAANPLAVSIGRFSLFRIEGHIGKDVNIVLQTLQNEIIAKNLPFTVRSVLLGIDKTKVIKRPGTRYSDLHRLHYLWRQDAYHQLNEVVRFSDKFKLEVDGKVTGESKATDFKRDAEQRNDIVKAKASSAATKLNRGYTAYSADKTWLADVSQTVTAASEFKYNIGDVVKTEFTTPFDSIIGNSRLQWLDWLDAIIQRKEDAADEKLLFTKFITEHPGVEHSAGVTRGGTFVLVHDSANTVVADFMLSYYWEDQGEEVPDEPPLTKPPIRSDFVIDRGIRILPSVKKGLTDFLKEPEFNQRLYDFTFEPVFTRPIDQQQKYMEIYKDYVSSTIGIFSQIEPKIAFQYTNPELGFQMREVSLNQEKLAYQKQQLGRPTLTDVERQAITEKVRQAETELATSIQKTTDYIARSNVDVSSGSEGFRAVLDISNSLGNLSREGQAYRNLQTELNNLQKRTTSAGIKTIIGNLINR
ncbi:hypothetical protein V0288_10810 [Pannus brasiliensis CCIBt3594]|uniref:Uncharacterized protein n=1 Tax=Pannus brasiliensis CCIBt3594 TaxID=1427578 RepID=A0AAW9QXQ3_9CHRO